MDPLPLKKFVFEISVNAVPCTKETIGQLYGGTYEEGKISIQTEATQRLGQFLQDAVTGCIMKELEHMAGCACGFDRMDDAQKRQHKYLKEKTQVSIEIESSVKFVRMEDI